MEDVLKLKEVYTQILKMYAEAGIINEVKWGYELNSDGSLRLFKLFIVPKNGELLEELFIMDEYSDSYAESLEGSLFENIIIMGKSYLKEVKIMVYGSGNTKFEPNDLEILEVL